MPTQNRIARERLKRKGNQKVVGVKLRAVGGLHGSEKPG